MATPRRHYYDPGAKPKPRTPTYSDTPAKVVKETRQLKRQKLREQKKNH